ncbi:MAG: ABC transporter substrate-binding protein [Acidimicrobiia bacterium]
MTSLRPRVVVGAIAIAIALVAASCGDDSTADDTTAATTAAAIPGGGSSATTATGAPATFPADRCDTNKKAGKLTFLTGFSFAAASSIAEVVAAKDKGYFDQMCLNVELQAGPGVTQNFALVGSNQAQFASAGSFSDVVNAVAGGGDFVSVIDFGKTGVNTLLVRDEGPIKTLADFKGKTIGIKFDLPPAIVAMLSQAGLKRGVDYKEVDVAPLGFDPLVHWKQPIDALAVFKSNEPNQLDAAGIKYRAFDPTASNIPGTFANVYTSKKFLTDNPTVAQDFVRAVLKGSEYAMANQADIVKLCLARDKAANGFLSEAGETFRWKTEAKIITDTTPKGQGVGVIDPSILKAEVEAYVKAGVFKTAPKVDGLYDENLAKSLYGADGKLKWPS